MAELTLRGIEKAYGDVRILRGIDLHADDGQLVVLVGPSGCGKSTLLRTIAGLETPNAGEILIGGVDRTKAPPKDRDVAMVFQSYALYPHLTVRKNLAFGLELRKAPAEVIASRITEVAQMLGLDALLDRYPRELSGGQRQRVAMGRAIARRPQLFLFDEPLSNLDAALRAEVRVEIKRLHHELGATMVYVTHDQVEAMTLADLLVVLNGGKVEQMGPPLELYERPATRFVAGFMGSPAMNFVDVQITDGVARGGGVEVRVDASEGAATLGLRPHDLRVDAGGAQMKLHVKVVEAMGFETYAHGALEGGDPETTFIARLEGDARPAVGDVLPLRIEDGAHHLFDEDGRRIEPAGG